MLCPVWSADYRSCEGKRGQTTIVDGLIVGGYKIVVCSQRHSVPVPGFLYLSNPFVRQVND